MTASPDLLGLDEVRALIASEDPEGRLPSCGLSQLIVGPGALDLLVAAVSRTAEGISGRPVRVALLVDQTTIQRQGLNVKSRVLADLQRDFEATHVVLSEGHSELHVTDAVVDEAARRCSDADVIVALGGGTISDIGKLVAARLPSVRVVTVMTAASVDGYTDDVSVTLKDGVKRTVPSVWPHVVLADAETVAEAPARMNQAGYGEMVSMYVAPADWRLASMLGIDTSFHRAPIALLEALGGALDACAAGVALGEPAAVQGLTQALAIRGIATGVAGTTACLSGVEHLISHMLDLRAAELHLPTGLHGEQVGAGSVVAACAWEMLHDRVSANPDATVSTAALDRGAAEIRVRSAFADIDPTGRIGSECWNDYERKLARVVDALPRIDSVLRNWPNQAAELRALARPSPFIATGLRAAGAPALLGELGSDVDTNTARWAVENCALMRERFTVVDLLTLLGWWTPSDLDEVLERVDHAVSVAGVPA